MSAAWPRATLMSRACPDLAAVTPAQFVESVQVSGFTVNQRRTYQLSVLLSHHPCQIYMLLQPPDFVQWQVAEVGESRAGEGLGLFATRSPIPQLLWHPMPVVGSKLCLGRFSEGDEICALRLDKAAIMQVDQAGSQASLVCSRLELLCLPLPSELKTEALSDKLEGGDFAALAFQAQSPRRISCPHFDRLSLVQVLKASRSEKPWPQ